MAIADWSPVLAPLALAWFVVICLTCVFLWKTRAEDDANADDETTNLHTVSTIMSTRH